MDKQRNNNLGIISTVVAIYIEALTIIHIFHCSKEERFLARAAKKPDKQF